MNFLFISHSESHQRELNRFRQCLEETGKHKYYYYHPYYQLMIDTPESPYDKPIQYYAITKSKFFLMLGNFIHVFIIKVFQDLLNFIFHTGKIKKLFPTGYLSTLLHYINVIFILTQRLISNLVIIKFINLYYNITMRKFHFVQHLNTVSVDVIILPEANIEFFTEIYSQEAKNRAVPCTIIPYTFCSPHEPAQQYQHRKHHQIKYFTYLIMCLFGLKKWVLFFNSKRLIRMPLHKILAIELLKCSPPLPWVQESSCAATIVSESKAVTSHYIKQSIDPKKIFTLGGYCLDLIHHSLKDRNSIKENVSQHFSNPDKKIIVCAFPPSCIDNQYNRSEFKNYISLVNDLLSVLKNQSTHNVIVNPHPAIKDVSIFYEHENDNLIVSRESIYTLLSICDVYIASISATIRWALTLELPVLNYDVYNFNYQDYEKLPSVITVTKREDFMLAFNQIITADALCNKKSQDHYHNDWGIIDGNFGKRFLNFCKQQIIENQKEFVLELQGAQN